MTSYKEQNKENSYGSRSSALLSLRTSGPFRETGNIPIILTLNSNSNANLMRVLFDLSKMLNIDPPYNYELIDEKNNRALQAKKSVSEQFGTNMMEVDEKCPNVRPPFCKFCEILIEKNEVIKKKFHDLGSTKGDDITDDGEYTFCSTNCYMQFALSHRPNENKETISIVNHHHHMGCDTSYSKPISSSPPSHHDNLPPSVMMEGDELSNLSPRLSSTVLDDKMTEQPVAPISALEDDDDTLNDASTINELSSSPIIVSNKQWKGIRYRNWSQDLINEIVVKDEAPKPMSERIDQEKLQNICIRPKQMPVDKRVCVLCRVTGDCDKECEGRLLNMDLDQWIHLNCALWSPEVYETQNGSLVNVIQACNKALSSLCVRCHQPGASVKCFKLRCTGVYHFACAIKDKCTFYKDKTVFCTQHLPKLTNQNEQMSSFEVPRKVYVNREEHQQIAQMIHQCDQSIIRIGSLIFMNIGQLLPHQLMAFHTPNSIYPIGYKICRFYWSARELNKRCKYYCSIYDDNGKPGFSVEVQEDGYENKIYKGDTPRKAWNEIISSIENMREKAGTIKLFTEYITGEDLFGLTEPSIVRILESLPGIDTLGDYNFKFNKSQLYELPLAMNPSGCARTEPKLRTHFKRTHTLHTSSSRSSLQSLSGTEVQSPYQKQFVHSKSSQYRKMKTEWRNNVYLARSRIAGLGLYAARDIEKHMMVIEYIGETIRNEIAERNERLYEQQNRRGVYMFRLDENRVVDATIKGGLARYVNHSCNPNCVAEVVQIDRENKILIVANRRIQRHEELCYDYRFEVEDDSQKIPCLCAAPNCKKWMN